MYSTCLYCHSSLGFNSAVERLPIGRRIAFDADKGRLWVICLECARWNLTPFEERWEATEECERLFERAPQRAALGSVCLARVSSEIELVRVRALAPAEFVNWRYTNALGAGFRKHWKVVERTRRRTARRSWYIAGGAS